MARRATIGQYVDHGFHDPLRVEYFHRILANRLAVHRLGLLNGFQIARQRPLFLVRFHALLPRWKMIHQHAGLTCCHERRTPGEDAGRGRRARTGNAATPCPSRPVSAQAMWQEPTMGYNGPRQ